MSRSLAFAVLCVASAPAGPAWADRSVEVQLAPDAPFSAGELASAIRVRVAADGPTIALQVTRTAGGVHVEVAGQARDVVLAERSGEAAARLVALAVSDLVMGDLAADPPPLTAPPHRVATVDADSGVLFGASSPAAKAPWVVAAIGSAASWSGGLAMGGIEVNGPLSGARIAAELSAGSLIGGDVGVMAAVARVSLGVRLGHFELRAGGVIAPIRVSTGAGDRTVLVGGTFSARVRQALSTSTAAMLAVGADAFATRTEYMLNGQAIAATPRFAPWLALGLEVAL